jgi:hypothetical protein
LFTCPNYTEIRRIMMNNLNWVQTSDLNLNLLTRGSVDLTYEENINIIKHVLQFIYVFSEKLYEQTILAPYVNCIWFQIKLNPLHIWQNKWKLILTLFHMIQVLLNDDNSCLVVYCLALHTTISFLESNVFIIHAINRNNTSKYISEILIYIILEFVLIDL